MKAEATAMDYAVKRIGSGHEELLLGGDHAVCTRCGPVTITNPDLDEEYHGDTLDPGQAEPPSAKEATME
jgi:hypothetical protein